MQKIALILLIALLISGCAIRKKADLANASLQSTNQLNVVEQVINQNLTNKSFFISRCEIEILSGDSKENVIGTIKFQTPDKYLISIRSKTGIEAARIYIDKDTILVNDRINRVLYCGSADYLKRKYGVSTALLPLLFGDFVASGNSDYDKLKCINDIAGMNMDLHGLAVNYSLDCKKGKLIGVRSGKILNKLPVNIEYVDFFRNGDSYIPGKISIEGIVSGTKLGIEIKKIESNWNGSVEFIPGNRYDIVDLL